MRAKERAEIQQAIRELMAEDPSFTTAIGRLCGLVGWRYPASEIDPDGPTITLEEVKRATEGEQDNEQ